MPAILHRLRSLAPRHSGIWLATALLFAISPALAPGSVTSTGLLSTLPFAAILAIAGIGQTLVIQQRGIDLSVPGMVTLSAIIITLYPHGEAGRLPAAIGLVVLACVASGVASGLAITLLDITPLVATLGVNALLIGVVYNLTNGSAASTATPGLENFSIDKTFGIPNTVLIAVGVVGVVALLMSTTMFGRRFVAAGASPAAGRAAGIRVKLYVLVTYVVASLSYGGAGILVAGYLRTPGIDAGSDYLLPTIAAVVLGGTSLAGGVGSVVATAGGALFLRQLEQVVLGMGAVLSTQYVIQGTIIAIGMALKTVRFGRLRERLLR